MRKQILVIAIISTSLIFGATTAWIANTHSTSDVSLESPQKKCKIIATDTTQVFFSPDDNITAHLLDEITNAKERIHAAIYMFTDKKLAQALVDAQARGIDVQVVADRISAETAFGKCETLAEHHIAVYLFEPPAHKKPRTKKKDDREHQKNEGWDSEAIMHNKFAVIDQKVATGSFNWTVKANKKNEENIVICSEQTVVEHYYDRFEELKRRSRRFIMPPQPIEPESTPAQPTAEHQVPLLPYIYKIFRHIQTLVLQHEASTEGL